MNKEEKEAIEELKKVRWNSLAVVVKNEDGKMDISYFTEKHKKTLLNLIQKQEQEIELLSKKLYLCTPEILQHEHQEYVSYADLVDKIMNQEKIIDKIWDLYYEYLSIRPASGMKFLKSKGFDVSKCEKCSFDDDNINCKECIKEYFKKDNMFPQKC